MTIKEISGLTGRTYKTVCNWCNSVKTTEISVKITEAKEKGKPADFTLDETIEILRVGKVSESLISLLLENAENKDRFKPVSSVGLTSKDVDIIKTIVSETVSMTIKTLDTRMANIESKYNSRVALLPAPELSDRDNLRQVINKRQKKTGAPFNIIWGDLYRSCYYRLNINFTKRAANRQMKVLDYIESSGYLPTVLSIAIEEFE